MALWSLRRSPLTLLAPLLRQMHTSTGKVLDLTTLNGTVKKAEYAVRGELAIKAETLKGILDKDPVRLPFPRITNCNIGNPQQLGQRPLSFFRQVSSLLDSPSWLDSPSITSSLPKDVVSRARSLLAEIGSIGAYSHSMGVPSIRRNVARFIEERDGFPADPDSIFLTTGASDGVKMVLSALISSPKVGVLIPIPQYPLYTASIALCNGVPAPYYLNEDKGWSLDMDEVIKGLYDARAKGVDVRAIVIINPGNPTGNVLAEDTIRDIIDLCHREQLLLLADEVYQTNVYTPEKPFHSFKKVLKSMGPKYSNFELISFHSISKGMVGECGRRGGYFECSGIDPEVMIQMYKLASISLCPNLHGQVLVDLMVNPPRPGSDSYALYTQEYTLIYESLKRRAKILEDAFNSLPRVSCQKAEGALYLFPKIDLPASAIEKAKSLGKEPDTLYCLELLEETGVCVVPGSGFLQRPGTYHFRSTFLPPEDQFPDFIARIRKFHEGFLLRYP